eukprot:scaffold1240_cov101-Isochrysis_galbana.AAC.17
MTRDASPRGQPPPSTLRPHPLPTTAPFAPRVSREPCPRPGPRRARWPWPLSKPLRLGPCPVARVGGLLGKGRWRACHSLTRRISATSSAYDDPASRQDST